MYPKTRLRELKGERATIFKDKEGEWNFKRETTMMWNQITNCIKKLLKRCLESQKGKDTIINKHGVV